MIESKIEDRYKGKGITLNETEHFEHEAKIALDIIVRWGMIAAEPDGEDSAGRQKARIFTPAELTRRAFETARLFMEGARLRGFIHRSPSISGKSDEKKPEEQRS